MIFHKLTRTDLPYNINNETGGGGNILIYKETKKAANEILSIFQENKYSPLLKAQPQQGKTSVAIAVAAHFIISCKDQNIKENEYQIIYISNKSDNEIRDQTYARFAQSFPYGLPIHIYHHSNLKKMISDKTITDFNKKTLVILDECHCSLGKDKPLEKFLKKLGIFYGKPIEKWENKNVYLLSISATPYVQSILELENWKYNIDSFKTVNLELNSDYLSLVDIYKSGRIKQLPCLILNKDKSDISDELKILIKNWLEKGIEKNNNFYYIIRAIGKNYSILKETLEKMQKINEEFGIACFCEKSNSNNENPINKLDGIISRPASKPTIILIKGALRAGKTLEYTKYIGEAIESGKSKSDSAAQAFAGRSCGHNKKNENYIIYCDKDAIKYAAAYYDPSMLNAENIIPNGNNNSSNFKKTDYQLEIEIFPFDEKQKSEIYKQAQNYYLASEPLKYKSSDNRFLNSTNVLSGRHYDKDFVKLIFEDNTNPEECPIWHFDSPQDNFIDSWNKYIKGSKYEGKILLLKKKKITNIIPSGNNNSSNYKCKNFDIEYEVFECFDDFIKEASIKEEKKNNKDRSKNNIKPWHKDIVSQFGTDDLADCILNKKYIHGQKNIIHVDAPHPKYLESWNKLKEKHPEYINKYLLITKKYHETVEYIEPKISDKTFLKDCLTTNPTDDTLDT